MNQLVKNFFVFLESLERRRAFDRLKKMRTFLLAVFFLVALIVVAAFFWGVKHPGYLDGYENGYRDSYKAAFDGNIYNVKAGLIGNYSYNDGYAHGYDEGYPEGQVDRPNQELKTIQERENSSDRENIDGNETSQIDNTS
jgi:nitrogen fixation-related uncharacterized protein